METDNNGTLYFGTNVLWAYFAKHRTFSKMSPQKQIPKACFEKKINPVTLIATDHVYWNE